MAAYRGLPLILDSPTWSVPLHPRSADRDARTPSTPSQLGASDRVGAPCLLWLGRGGNGRAKANQFEVPPFPSPQCTSPVYCFVLYAAAEGPVFSFCRHVQLKSIARSQSEQLVRIPPCCQSSSLSHTYPVLARGSLDLERPHLPVSRYTSIPGTHLFSPAPLRSAASCVSTNRLGHQLVAWSPNRL
ncbi:hypothetical protein BT67DRAFT_183782 [Trichocladium antarcticum]|uniref:Uncharacterized protein n=1 Tax=Trichocladium antarcticum TaxID=1450529 RepID=A0AAN6ZG35_9PEZI|nr:hypothetical protein BT67DRAFT_183782 [Trichocladium antarcticum]